MSDERACSEIDRVLGATLQGIRLDAELSQQALAERLGISFQQVQKYEGGAHRISAARLFDIATILKIPLSHLFRDVVGEADVERQSDLEDLQSLFNGIDDERVQQRIIDLVKAIGVPSRR